MCKCHLEINKKEASHDFDPLGQITNHDVGIGYDNDLMIFYPSNLGLYETKPNRYATKTRKHKLYGKLGRYRNEDDE